MRKVSVETVIRQVQLCYDKYGKVSRSLFDNDDNFVSGKTLYNKLGGIEEACEKAGVPYVHPNTKTKVKIQCLQCGKYRNVYPYRAKKEFPDKTSENCKFCMNKKVTVCCDWCGDDIIKHNYTIEKHELHFCNKECLGKWRSDNIIGKNHPRYNGGRKMFGSNWNKRREEAILRDNECCQHCGVDRETFKYLEGIDLDVHHMKPRREFIENGDSIEKVANDIDNLITLCRPCHIKEEWS